MEGTNDSWHYALQANGIVKKDPAGTFFEEYQWSGLRSNDQAVVLSPASLEFRQQLTLDPNRNPAMPSLSQADPRLIGPITDLMNFYVDLWLAVKTGAPAVAIAHNAGLLWPKNAFVKRPGTITVQIGAPIESRGVKPEALNAQVEQWIESQMESLCPK